MRWTAKPTAKMNQSERPSRRLRSHGSDPIFANPMIPSPPVGGECETVSVVCETKWGLDEHVYGRFCVYADADPRVPETLQQ